MAVTNIYTLDCPITGEVKYVGKTNRPAYRLRQHKEEALRESGLNKKNAWIKSLINKGLAPVMTVIDSVDSSEWVFWEMHYISLYKSFGFNLKNDTRGGDGGISLESARMGALKRIGLRMPQSHIDKSRSRMIGNKCALNGTHRRKEVVCFNTITGAINYYPSSHHAGAELGLSHSTIRNNICGLSLLVSNKYKFFN